MSKPQHHRIYHVQYVDANGETGTLETLADQLWDEELDGVITAVKVLEDGAWREATAVEIARDQRLLTIYPM